MNLFIPISADFSFENEKGFLIQLAHEGWKQINFIESKKGTHRGEHYHKVSNEAFYIAYGSVDIKLKKIDSKTNIGGEIYDYHFSKGDFFKIPTFVWHSMTFPEDCIMVALYDLPIEKEDGTKDIYEEGEK